MTVLGHFIPFSGIWPISDEYKNTPTVQGCIALLNEIIENQKTEESEKYMKYKKW